MKHVINVETKWSKLFKVKCFHDFYHDGICRDLVFKPTNRTLIDMSNLNLVYREQKGGFIILCKKDSTLPLLKSKYSRVKKLTFYLDARGKDFYNFSEIPFSSFEKIHYISNRQGGVNEKEGYFLHEGDSVNLEEERRLGIRPKFFSINLEKPIKKLEPLLTDIFGDEINPKSYTIKGDENLQTFYADFRGLDEGAYLLNLGGYKASFYLMEDFSDFHWAILEVYLKDGPEEIKLYNDDKVLGRNFLFKIQPRRTFWKYIFVEKENDFKEGEINEVKVTNDGEELSFTKPEAHELMNGRGAVMIESKEPLQLKEIMSSRDKVEMKMKRGKKWMTKVVRAPKPQKEMLKPDGKTKRIYSTIYVNI